MGREDSHDQVFWIEGVERKLWIFEWFVSEVMCLLDPLPA